MKHIDYFKLQAKNLFKDFKSKTQKHFLLDDAENIVIYEYNYEEKDFCLMKAQHIIANIARFKCWADLLKATETELEVVKLLFDNKDLFLIDQWHKYLADLKKKYDCVTPVLKLNYVKYYPSLCNFYINFVFI